jgi:hypothetical protein
MKKKKELIILLAVIAVLSLYLVFRKTDRTHYQLPKVTTLEEKAITKIEIDKGTLSIVLDKKSSGWEITPQKYKADADKVQRMLDVLKNLTLTALVSEAQDYARYDLTGDKNIRVRAWASEELKRDLDVGKTVPTYQHTFVKLAGDSRVYHARDNFRDTFDQTVGDLRDKSVLSLDPNKIREIFITKGKTVLALKRKEGPAKPEANLKTGTKGPVSSSTETVWEEAGGKKINQKEVDDLLDNLSHLKCERYLEGTKEDLKDPILTIHLKGEKDFQLSLFTKQKKEDNAYPAVSSDNAYPSLITSWNLEKIIKDPNELYEKTKP